MEPDARTQDDRTEHDPPHQRTIAHFIQTATMTMERRRTMSDPAELRRVDAALHYVSLLTRCVAYLLLGGFADHYACGQAILTGMFFGDVAATIARHAVPPRDGLRDMLADLALLGLVYLWTHSTLAWPPHPANRAIVTLAAIGVFATRTSHGLLTRFGTDDFA